MPTRKQKRRELKAQRHDYEFVYVDGGVKVDCGGESIDARAGELFRFDPDERRTVTARDGARILLMLAPWPGVGHYRGDRGPAAVSAS